MSTFWTRIIANEHMKKLSLNYDVPRVISEASNEGLMRKKIDGFLYLILEMQLRPVTINNHVNKRMEHP